MLSIPYYLLYENFSIGNYYFFLITASTFLIFIYDVKDIITKSLLNKFIYLTSIILLFEAIFGLLQSIIGFSIMGSFDYQTGDIIKGTIEPIYNYTLGSGSNQMFAILMSTLYKGLPTVPNLRSVSTLLVRTGLVSVKP